MSNDLIQNKIKEIVENPKIKKPVAKVEEIELYLRKRFLDIAKDADNANYLSDCVDFIKTVADSCLDLVDQEGLQLAAKIPFYLLDDFMECTTFTAPEKADILIHKFQFLVVESVLFQSGKLLLLRVSNWLLQQLSRIRHAQECGQILIYLAQIFPITERSALNVTGKYNTAIQVDFESEEEFNRHVVQSNTSKDEEVEEEQKENSDNNDDVMDVDESSDGVLAKQEVKVDEITILDLRKELSRTKKLDQFHPDRQPVDYKFYRTIWKLQKFLREPLFLLKGSDKDMDEFTKSVTVILNAFEASPLSELEQITQKSTPSPSSDNDNETDSFIYLTSSKILRLQLRDPNFRIYQMAQMMITINFLLKQESLGNNQKAALNDLASRVGDIMGHTSRVGKFASTLMISLLKHREILWVKWKAAKCKAFDKYPSDPWKNSVLHTVGMKQPIQFQLDFKYTQEDDLLDQSLSNTNNESVMDTDDGINDMARLPEQLTSVNVINFEEFIESYVEACDPESGIEEEYHPKNNQLYNWRLGKILFSDFPQYMHHVTKWGNFEPAVRAIMRDKGKPIPDPPSPEDPEDLEKYDEMLFDGSDHEGDDEKEAKEDENVSQETPEKTIDVDIESRRQNDKEVSEYNVNDAVNGSEKIDDASLFDGRAEEPGNEEAVSDDLIDEDRGDHDGTVSKDEEGEEDVTVKGNEEATETETSKKSNNEKKDSDTKEKEEFFEPVNIDVKQSTTDKEDSIKADTINTRKININQSSADNRRKGQSDKIAKGDGSRRDGSKDNNNEVRKTVKDERSSSRGGNRSNNSELNRNSSSRSPVRGRGSARRGTGGGQRRSDADENLDRVNAKNNSSRTSSLNKTGTQNNSRGNNNRKRDARNGNQYNNNNNNNNNNSSRERQPVQNNNSSTDQNNRDRGGQRFRDSDRIVQSNDKRRKRSRSPSPLSNKRKRDNDHRSNNNRDTGVGEGPNRSHSNININRNDNSRDRRQQQGGDGQRGGYGRRGGGRR